MAIDSIPDPKCADLADSLLGPLCPTWLCDNFAKDMWEFIEDWLIVHADDITEAKIR